MQRKTSFIVKVSTTQKSLNHHEKASTPTLVNVLISPKILNPGACPGPPPLEIEKQKKRLSEQILS